MDDTSRDTDRARRRFLLASAASAGLVWLPGCGGGNSAGNDSASTDTGDDTGDTPDRPEPLQRGNLGHVIGPGRGGDAGREMRYFVGMIDLDAEEPAYTQIDDIHFFGHGVTPNPVKPKTAVIFEKHGKGCAEVDLAAARTLRRIETVRGREFYGHGAFTPDGKTLFATEAITGDHSYDGVVAVRDGESFELKGTFPTYGIAPHDCILIDEGNTLVITNGGGPIGNEHELPSVTYVDVPSETLKHEITFPTKRINAGHLAITGRGDLVVVSAPREGLDKGKDPGSISFYSPGGEVRTIVDAPIRKKMISETLSVAIHEPTMVVGATNPKGHLVTFWDFKTGKLVKAFDGDFKNARGISVTLDQRYFVVTYDQRTWMAVIDAETLEVIEDFKTEPTYISGSHNITYDLPL